MVMSFMTNLIMEVCAKQLKTSNIAGFPIVGGGGVVVALPILQFFEPPPPPKLIPHGVPPTHSKMKRPHLKNKPPIET